MLIFKHAASGRTQEVNENEVSRRNILERIGWVLEEETPKEIDQVSIDGPTLIVPAEVKRQDAADAPLFKSDEVWKPLPKPQPRPEKVVNKPEKAER